MIFTTVTTYNNLDLTRVLAKSIKQHMPSSKLVVCLVEGQLSESIVHIPDYDRIVLAKDLGFPNFYTHIFKHNSVEACTSVKARLFQYLMRSYPREDKFVFLDGDIEVFGPFIELEDLLNEHSIVLSPHILHPEQDVVQIRNNELNLARFGMYNLGFIAVRRSEMGLKFLNWWQSRLDLFCYIEPEKQIFTDQRWIDFAPSFFDVYILKHPGYNAAPWNLSFRNIERAADGSLTVDGKPLRFFHWSGLLRLKGNYKGYMAMQAGVNELVLQLTENYQREVLQYRTDLVKEEAWAYDFFTSGERIDHETRLAFRNQANTRTIQNPFTLSNKSIQLISAMEYKNKNTVIFGTIATRKYLPSAILLATTLKEQNPNSKVALCFVGAKGEEGLESLPCVDHVVYADAISIPPSYQKDYEAMCRVLKPRFLSYLYELFSDEEKFILLDADIQVFSPFNELTEILNHTTIVLTPHILHPEHDITYFKDTEGAVNQFGMYDPGFIAVKRDLSVHFFTNWWADRAARNYPRNWLAHAPAFFQVNILRDPGYNVAPWNIYHRAIEERLPNIFTVNNQPLRFFHFSGAVDSDAKTYIQRYKRHPGDQRALEHLVSQYYQQLSRYGKF